MKKNDWIMIAVVIAAAAVFTGFHFFGKNSGSGRAEVQVDGEIYGSYPLDIEQTVDINGTNRLTIVNGTVKIEWASCPDQVCVHHREISRNGESIICLPNQVVVSIVDGEEPELDAVVN